MEVRCGSCNKLFRVSDDKIAGTGIKFPCTRCREYVRITRQDFEHYTMSQSAVSVLDLFEPKPKPATPPLSPEAVGSVPEETASPSQGSMPFEPAEPSTHEDSAGGMSPPSAGPDHAPSTTTAEPEPAAELKPEPLMPLKHKAEQLVEPQSEQKLASKPLSVPQPGAATALKSELQPEPVRPLAPIAPPSIPPARPAMPKKEATHPSAPPVSRATERSVKEPILPSTPSRSGRMFLVLFIALIISGLAAYGIFFYLPASPPSLSSPQGWKEAARETVSIEGLQLVNPGGSVQANGDLLITGVIQNTTEKERTAWYVVAEVYNAQGGVLSKIRLLNGKQIYSRSDYDILAGRGVNVQELKAKNLQDKGVIIPPKGTVSFEMRYLQPPAGIASFDTQLLPFDPVQLYREIAGEVK